MSVTKYGGFVAAVVTLAGMALVCAPVASEAVPITYTTNIVCETEFGASCTSATLKYNDTTHLLTFSLTNNGLGFYTSLGFETPGDLDGTFVTSGSTAGYVGSTSNGNFGLGASWDEAAGGPNVSAPNTLVLNWTLTGSNLSSDLSAAIANAANKTGDCGGSLAWGCLHVQGLTEAPSAKLSLQADTQAVPEPSTWLVLAMGLAAASVAGRKVRTQPL